MMKVQILGPGCGRCKILAENTERAAQELGLDLEVEKITDLDEMLSFGLVATPALVIDGEIKVSGKVVTPEEIKALLV